jgi:DTW domain-containing protein
MNIEQYKKQRLAHLENTPKTRDLCVMCMQPSFGCYCAEIQKFDPQIKFVILIHPIEWKRRIATGRMSHLCMHNSELIVEQDYTNCNRVNELLTDSRYQPMVLYPGQKSLNLTGVTQEKIDLLVGSQVPMIFVIDGTWATARKTMRLSRNLNTLPRVCFTPPARSNFQVRKQPKVECYSTIEAVHHTIELLGPAVGFNLQTRQHDNLLHVFRFMVNRQISFLKDAFDNPRSTSYRRPRNRVA